MKNISEQLLINNLLSNNDLNVDWQSILPQAKAENWHASTQIHQQVLEDFLRYPASEIEKIIGFFCFESSTANQDLTCFK